MEQFAGGGEPRTHFAGARPSAEFESSSRSRKNEMPRQTAVRTHCRAKSHCCIDMPFPEHQQFCLIAELNINYTYNERQLLPANAVESGSANKSQRQAVAIISKLARCMHLVASLHMNVANSQSITLPLCIALHYCACSQLRKAAKQNWPVEQSSVKLLSAQQPKPSEPSRLEASFGCGVHRTCFM